MLPKQLLHIFLLPHECPTCSCPLCPYVGVVPGSAWVYTKQALSTCFCIPGCPQRDDSNILKISGLFAGDHHGDAHQQVLPGVDSELAGVALCHRSRRWLAARGPHHQALHGVCPRGPLYPFVVKNFTGSVGER